MNPLIEIRPVVAEDYDFLREMLYEAAWMEKTGETRSCIEKTAMLRQYVIDWGRQDDVGFIACDKETGDRYGAAWSRIYDKPDCLAGFPGPLPELAMATVPQARGKGIGKTLLQRLIADAKQKYDAICLNVREENRAAITLYEKMGFQKIEGSGQVNRSNSISFYMLAQLQGA
jgi:RimJ/RimL family protein N-acetyltransferase